MTTVMRVRTFVEDNKMSLIIGVGIVLICIALYLNWANSKNNEAYQNFVATQQLMQHLDNYENFEGTPSKKVVLFYAPWCGHCKTFRTTDNDESKWAEGSPDPSSEWGKFYHKFTSEGPSLGIHVQEIDCDVDDSLAKKYDVQGYPTVKIISDTGDATEYTGERTYQGLYDFVMGK